MFKAYDLNGVAPTLKWVVAHGLNLKEAQMRPIFRVQGLLFVLVALVIEGPGSLAQAQQDPLSAICHGFLSSSGAPAPGKADVLCSCLVDEVQSNLTVAEMQAYQSAADSSHSMPPSVQRKITSIAVKCLSQVQ